MPDPSRTAPSECASLADVRAEIDRVDREVLDLLALRARYVAAAAPFKSSEHDVQAPDRVRAMLETRRAWATKRGLDEDFVEHFVGAELAGWRTRPGNTG